MRDQSCNPRPTSARATTPPRPRTTARVAATATVGLALVLTACTSSSTGSPPAAGGSTSVAGATTGTVSTGTLPDGTCAWSVKADQATLNIAYPDTAATYWGLSYSLAPGESVRLHGTFPAARYFSFITYGANGGAIATATDRDLVPDPGSTNPYRPTGTAGGTAPTAGGQYTLTIVDAASVDDPNQLPARAPDTGTSTGTSTGTTPSTNEAPTAGGAGTTPPANAPAKERVFLGSGGTTGTKGSVLYRVYVPTDPSDPTGGGGLPSAEVVAADGTVTAVPTCPNPGPSEAAKAIVDGFNRPNTPVPATPVFIRPAGNQANLYPNPDNVYVATLTAHQPGKVVVVRGKSPTFPDTRAGQPITGDEQVRYWSMCTNEYRKPYPVTACAADYQATLDADGWYTFVISTPEDRPATTPATADSTWLDWGATDVTGLLLMRNMLADPSFPEAASNLAPGTLASPAMGDYAPKAVYCDKATFEQGGATACGL